MYLKACQHVDDGGHLASWSLVRRSTPAVDQTTIKESIKLVELSLVEKIQVFLYA